MMMANPECIYTVCFIQVKVPLSVMHQPAACIRSMKYHITYIL